MVLLSEYLNSSSSLKKSVHVSQQVVLCCIWTYRIVQSPKSRHSIKAYVSSFAIIITHQSNQKTTTTTTRAITISFLNFGYNIPSVSFKSMYISFYHLVRKMVWRAFWASSSEKKRITLHCYHHTHNWLLHCYHQNHHHSHHLSFIITIKYIYTWRWW